MGRGHGAHETVVPAHAGVVLSSRPRAVSNRRRPRARGGRPPSSIGSARHRSSSPRTRGSSGTVGASESAPPVVPAHAGVVPAGRLPPTGSRSRPRARGGRPFCGFLRPFLTPSSPRTRGSSWLLLAPGRSGAVVPAHAGVVPWTRAVRRRPSRRPRARGGGPFPCGGLRVEALGRSGVTGSRSFVTRILSVGAGFIWLPQTGLRASMLVRAVGVSTCGEQAGRQRLRRKRW